MPKPGNRLFNSLLVLSLVLVYLPVCQTASADTSTSRLSSGENFRQDPSTAGIKLVHATWQTSKRTYEAAPGFEWRNTKLGWQQVRVGPTPTIHRLNPPQYRPVFHPFLIAALILLLALVALSWSSDEWNWNRLVTDNPDDDGRRSAVTKPQPGN